MLRLVPARPQEVNWSIFLQFVALAIGPIATGLDWKHLQTLAPIQKVALNAASTLLFIGFFIWKMSQGRNWARITLLVFFLVSLPFYFFFVRAEFGRSSILALLSILQALFQGAGLLVAFIAPTKYWFTKPASA
jgi:hypothetical protein